MNAIDELLSRARFGMQPGLENIAAACSAFGHPELKLGKVIHVAGTNGKGQVCAALDAALRAQGFSVARYTSPHLVKVNERFFFDGEPISDADLDKYARKVLAGVDFSPRRMSNLSYFESLTLLAFLYYADKRPDYTILETGLGGRLDATNVCSPILTLITHVGLDHCEWLGDTVEKIREEKRGIKKPGVPHLEFDDFKFEGSFWNQNNQFALMALKTLTTLKDPKIPNFVWPGRLQRINNFILDGAHNPPGATALVKALQAQYPSQKFHVIYGACGDKDVDTVLSILKPIIASIEPAVSSNPRALSIDQLQAHFAKIGLPAGEPERSPGGRGRPVFRGGHPEGAPAGEPATLICGSLFLIGDYLVKLGVYPWGSPRHDPNERLKP